jgi:hypothetical protein
MKEIHVIYEWLISELENDLNKALTKRPIGFMVDSDKVAEFLNDGGYITGRGWPINGPIYKYTSETLKLLEENTNAQDIRQTSKKLTRESEESPCNSYKPVTKGRDTKEGNPQVNKEGAEAEQKGVKKRFPEKTIGCCSDCPDWEKDYDDSSESCMNGGTDKQFINPNIDTGINFPPWCPLENA